MVRVLLFDCLAPLSRFIVIRQLLLFIQRKVELVPKAGHAELCLVLLCLPELRHLIIVTFADGALVIIAHALLRPKRAFTLHVHLERPEER